MDSVIGHQGGELWTINPANLGSATAIVCTIYPENFELAIFRKREGLLQSIIEITQNGTLRVVVRPNGEVEFGSDFGPKQTADAFWRGLCNIKAIRAAAIAMTAPDEPLPSNPS